MSLSTLARAAAPAAFGAIGLHEVNERDWPGLVIALLAALVSWLQSRRR